MLFIVSDKTIKSYHVLLVFTDSIFHNDPQSNLITSSLNFDNKSYTFLFINPASTKGG